MSGFAVCVTALPLQVFPITGVTDKGFFGVKVAGLVIAIEGIGAWLYWRGTRRLARRLSSI